jgi:hypothetical protein
VMHAHRQLLLARIAGQQPAHTAQGLTAAPRRLLAYGKSEVAGIKRLRIPALRTAFPT